MIPGPAVSVCPSDLGGLTSLSAEGRNITDLTELDYCTSLTQLELHGNRISDISLLVDNEGLLGGDEVYLNANPLSSASINTYMPQLEARGVTVYY